MWLCRQIYKQLSLPPPSLCVCVCKCLLLLSLSVRLLLPHRPAVSTCTNEVLCMQSHCRYCFARMRSGKVPATKAMRPTYSNIAPEALANFLRVLPRWPACMHACKKQQQTDHIRACMHAYTPRCTQFAAGSTDGAQIRQRQQQQQQQQKQQQQQSRA